MAIGGLRLEELSEADRRAAGLASDALGLRINIMGRHEELGAGRNAGFKVKDIVD